MDFHKCIVCESALDKDASIDDSNKTIRFRFACKRCGVYYISDGLEDLLRSLLTEDPKAKPKLSHWIRQTFDAMNNPSDLGRGRISPVQLDNTRLLENILSNPSPNPAEQLSNYICWIGDRQDFLGDDVPVNRCSIIATIGSFSGTEYSRIHNQLIKDKLITEKGIKKGEDGPDIERRVSLSFEGWEKYEELRKTITVSRTAFMAMKFREEDLDKVYYSTFKPAVADTGFELFKLDEKPKAGLIDSRMRVEIRKSRFLISDLTHRNPGAYWEAGFAEGLGKPVIYTCRKKEWDQDQTHFDTNHHLTIVWDPQNPSDAAEELKATIRATLPGEAKMSD